jgi:hypothetical protein
MGDFCMAIAERRAELRHSLPMLHHYARKKGPFMLPILQTLESLGTEALGPIEQWLTDNKNSLLAKVSSIMQANQGAILAALQAENATFIENAAKKIEAQFPAGTAESFIAAEIATAIRSGQINILGAAGNAEQRVYAAIEAALTPLPAPAPKGPRTVAAGGFIHPDDLAAAAAPPAA